MLCAMRGILGGTFDPPHIGHLAAAETAYRQLDLDVVSFLPAGMPWQKLGSPVSEVTDRWSMLGLALAGTAYFEADDREVRRRGPTFTADTLETFPRDDEVVLILGADAALGTPTWERAADVIERVVIAVVPRSGVERAEVAAAVGAPIVWLEMPMLDVSGTMLRAMVRSGRSIRFLVPDAVWAYVNDRDLYRSPGA